MDTFTIGHHSSACVTGDLEGASSRRALRAAAVPNADGTPTALTPIAVQPSGRILAIGPARVIRLKVDGSKWRDGTPSANLADQAKRLYGDRYAEFLDGVKAFAFFPLAIAREAPPPRDIRVRLRFYPLAGKIDQAAGIAFGIQTDGSYLGVRANALGLAGHSFGARVSLMLQEKKPAIRALLLVAPPLPEPLPPERHPVCPYLVVIGDQDGNLEPGVDVYRSHLPDPEAMRLVPGPEHMWHGYEHVLSDAARDFFAKTRAAPAQG